MCALHSEEIVYAETRDGILHAGIVIRPTAGSAKPLPIVWLHGFTGRFYEPHAIRIGRDLAARGYVFVAGHNRGNNFGIIVRPKGGEPVLAGAGWERFDESPHDVAAWIDFTVQLGFSEVALLGHSLGALKVGYYQAQRQDPRVRTLIAASPPARAGRINPEVAALAERMVAAGQGTELLPPGSSTVGVGRISAQTYLNRVQTNVDVYGFHTPNPAVAQIRCPLLAFYGTNEEQVGTRADLETIRQNATAAPRVETRVIQGADHVYTGHEAEVAALLAEWVDSLTR